MITLLELHRTINRMNQEIAEARARAEFWESVKKPQDAVWSRWSARCLQENADLYTEFAHRLSRLQVRQHDACVEMAEPVAGP